MTVARRSFSLTLAERGYIAPARVVPIKSKIASNRGQIIWLADEGIAVNQGLIVARFDPQPFLDKLNQAEQELADARAQLIAAKHALALQAAEEQAQIKAAERQLALAKLKAQDREQGSALLTTRQYEQRVAQAERKLAQAEQAQTDLVAIATRGHGPKRELEKARDHVQTAQEELVLAQMTLAHYQTFEQPQLQQEAAALLADARHRLDHAKQTSDLHLAQRQADVAKFERRVAHAQSTLDKAREDVTNCDVYAPSPGILLYKKIPQQGEQRKIQVGDTVWFGQTFLEIPDTEAIVVPIEVREIDVAKLAVGMAAQIQLDALAHQRFTGAIAAIDSLAITDDQASQLRRFRTRIRVDHPTSQVHIGMSATVFIDYQQLDNVLTVPVQALIFHENGITVEQVLGQKTTSVPVEIGAVGATWAELRAGLEVGDRLLLPDWD